MFPTFEIWPVIDYRQSRRLRVASGATAPGPALSIKKNRCPQTGNNFMNNEKTKFVRQVAKVDLV